MRLYTLTNVYLSSIQKGIQSAHLAVDLVRKYDQKIPQALPPYKDGIFSDKDDISTKVRDWADNHKTMIVLNSGNSAMLGNLQRAFEIYDVQAKKAKSDRTPVIPYAFFREDEESMNGTLTCVGCILPKTLYSVTCVDDDEGYSVAGLPWTSEALHLTNDFIPYANKFSQCNLAYLLATMKRCSLAI